MSSPGDVEHVPLKVVPMYVEGETPPTDRDEPDPSEIEVPEQARRWPLIGVIALVIAVATAVFHGVAVSVASDGDAAGGTALASVAIGLSVLAAVAGILALILNRGRITGAVAVVLAVLANPFVLLVVLRWVAGG